MLPHSASPRRRSRPHRRSRPRAARHRHAHHHLRRDLRRDRERPGRRLNVAVTKDGRILAYTGNPTPGTTVHGSWTSSPAAALSAVAGKLAKGVAFTPHKTGTVAGYTTFARGPFAGSSYVKQAIFGTASRPGRRLPRLLHQEPRPGWDTLVNASTGAILFRASVVAHESDPTDPTTPQGKVYDNYPAPRRAAPHTSCRSARRPNRRAATSTRPAWPAPASLLRQQRVDVRELVELRRAGRPRPASDRSDR